MIHELIDPSLIPTIPCPWSSTDPGEAWVWGDFILLMQTKPKSFGYTIAKKLNAMEPDTSLIRYEFAMTVFYRPDKNPHGSVTKPVLIASLEKLDNSATGENKLQARIGSSETSNIDSQPAIKGLFIAKKRCNLGLFLGSLTHTSARSYFFDLIRDQLSLTGEPKLIGPMSAVHGHPETGWPAEQNRTQRKLIRLTCRNCGNSARLPNDSELIYDFGPMGQNGLQNYHLYCRRCKIISIYEPPGCLSLLFFQLKPKYYTNLNLDTLIRNKYPLENLLSQKILNAVYEDGLLEVNTK